MRQVKTKICGLNDAASVKSAMENGADFLGFIFYPRSPRHISLETAALLGSLVPENIKKVAVTVDSTDDDLEKIIGALKPDYLQLHGSESVERVKKIKGKFGLPVIKALKVKSAGDIENAGLYENAADFLMFDAKAPDEVSMLPGGNGISFDWLLLKDQHFYKPWILSGGLNADNIKSAIDVTEARIVDISSGVESSAGKKDSRLIEQFLKTVREL